jgi:nitrogen fixation/metabolism regulation signal transduction histidine kinase
VRTGRDHPRRRGPRTGMRLGPRLFLLVVLSSLLPAALILLTGWLQLRQQMRLWTIPSVETALEASLQTNRKAFDRLERQLEMEGRVLVESPVFPSAPDDTTGLAKVLEAGCRQFGIDLAQFYAWERGAFRLLSSRTLEGSQGPDASAQLQIPGSAAVGPQRVSPLRLHDGNGDYLALPIFLWRPSTGEPNTLPPPRGALVLGASLGAQYYSRLGEVSNGLFFYRRLEEVGLVLRTGYGVLAGIVLLLSLAFSLWMARKAARSVSRPVEDLVRGMEAVGRNLPSEAVAASAGAASGRPEANARIPEIARLADAFALMQAALQSYEDRLRESERVRGAQETARFVAHEIRNTLTPVRAALSVLERQVGGLVEEPRERADRALVLIRREADRMAALAGAFSEYARFPERKPVPCALGPLLSSLARHEIPPRIRLQLEVDETLPAIQADRDEMERLFRNLIKNAVESIAENGTIRLALRRQAGAEGLEILLEDSGCGIDPETLRKVFHPGFTTKETGTGLGLALVRSSLSHYGGIIRLESAKGSGTMVRISLPWPQEQKE